MGMSDLNGQQMTNHLPVEIMIRILHFFLNYTLGLPQMRKSVEGNRMAGKGPEPTHLNLDSILLAALKRGKRVKTEPMAIKYQAFISTVEHYAARVSSMARGE